MRVVIAPDAFKGTFSAKSAAEALAQGWLAERPRDNVVCLPLADGGEGTLDVLAASIEGAQWQQATVTGPGGEPVNATWLRLPGEVAAMEIARCSGLPLMRQPDALGAHTFGLGELIGRALDDGAKSIMIGLGGSATTDGGTGALTALGARFLDQDDRQLPLGGGFLISLASRELGSLRKLPPGGVTCLVDVTAPLLGPRGSAAVYAPQKGADAGQAAVLATGLARLAEVLGGSPDAPGAGAAGGTAYGLAAVWGAVITPGAPRLCQLAGLEDALERADLVITGEGRFDFTSLTGKVTGTIIAAAEAAGIPVVLVSGQQKEKPPVRAVTLAELAGETERAMAMPGEWLRRAGAYLARAQVHS
jgi:glycerate 2-kinase